MNEDVAKIVFGYIGFILCGTFSITNKLNLNEQIDANVIYSYLGFLWYIGYSYVGIEVYTKLLY